VELPDIGPLSSLPSKAWRALGERLRAIGLDAQAVAPYWAIAAAGGDPLRAPLAKWHLRRERTLTAYAMRMFMFWDAVSPAEAQATLGDELPLEKMLECGLLRRTDAGGVVSPFAMRAVSIGGADLVLADDLTAGGDAVMGPSQATMTLTRLAYPLARVERALDLGCGPGTLALALSPMCDRVVATDVSPRAIALARVNASMNGVQNVELRTGDLFAPVAGESFDLVTSHPPFVPCPADMPVTPFLFGGPRGDELPLRILGEVATHLEADGLALMTVSWPVAEGDRVLLERLRDRLGPSADLSLLLLFGQADGIDEQAVLYGGLQHPDDHEGRERDVIRFRDHFEQHRIHHVIHTYAALRRGAGAGWTTAVPLAKMGDAPASRESLDALFAEADRTVATAGPAALLF
jgi:SAM-dependent methyltransferase